MSLTPGTRFGPFDVIAQIGAGGMGEVWRARDSQLGRDVALKILPAAVAGDPDRLMRFEREAKALASLNHPNIAQIHGLENAEGTRALVMELVEGEDLSQRIARGAIPIEDALPIARQVADALEAAHGAGIIHRDLKPANIKVRDDGTVKVLDFGLAKAIEGDGSGLRQQDPSPSSATMTSPALTQMGVILGTAAYMAPEQARGKPVDRRADIWAFGVVLYEMLTGQRAFDGEDVSLALSAVLQREPDWSALPAGMPPALSACLRRCLKKDPKQRIHDIADARIVIDDVIEGRGLDESPAPAAVVTRRGGVLPWAVAGALAVLLAVSIATRPSAPPAAMARSVEVALPPGYLLDPNAAPVIAPDGSALVFGATDATRVSRLFLRRLDRFEIAPLEGTENAESPFWSPDARAIAFYSGSSLRRYDLETRSTQVILKTGTTPRGGSWGADGTILFTSSNAPIQRVPATGGVPEAVTELDTSVVDGSHRYPVFLPDGKRFLFTFWSNNLDAATRVGGIYLGFLDKQPIRRLTPDLSAPILTGDRLLVYRDGGLVALPFDPATGNVGGAGEVIADKPLYSFTSGALGASASRSGDVAFALESGEGSGELTWLDRQGTSTGAIGVERLNVSRIALAPDSQHFALEVRGASGILDIWIGDVDRRIVTRLTRGSVDRRTPRWSPDSRQVVFSDESTGLPSVFIQPADGSRPEELLVSDPKMRFDPSSWSADGKWLFLDAVPEDRPDAPSEIWAFDFAARSPRAILSDRSANLSQGKLSPDGKWLAYVSDESGNPEVFVRPFPALDQKWKLSQGGAQGPHWRADGREVIFRATADTSVQGVSVTPNATKLLVGTQELLFRLSATMLAVTPTADHQRFLTSVIPGDVRSEPMRVMLGWRSAQR